MEEIKREPLKVIFLDIDGVLNSIELGMSNVDNGLPRYGGFFNELDKCTHGNVLWGQEQVNRLKRIVHETGAKIVISSTWRLYFSVDKFIEMFSVYGWKNAPIIDKTLSLPSSRGVEVKTWLDSNTVSNYVIIDDTNDFLEYQQSKFVHTEMMDGLSEQNTKQAIEILNDGRN